MWLKTKRGAIQLAVSCSELNFTHCCALNTRVGKQGYVFILGSGGVMFHSRHYSLLTIILRLGKSDFFE